MRCSHDIMLLHQDLYIPADAKMVKAGYQYDNCGHSEVMENVFKIAHTFFSMKYYRHLIRSRQWRRSRQAYL